MWTKKKKKKKWVGEDYPVFYLIKENTKNCLCDLLVSSREIISGQGNQI